MRLQLLNELLKFALKRNPRQRSVRIENELTLNTGDEDEDPCFRICIMGLQPTQAAQFETRGRHPHAQGPPSGV